MTKSRCENAVYCFIDAEMVRNSHIEKVSGDALQNSRLVLNSTLHNIDDEALSGHHTDMLQYFGHHENVVVCSAPGSLDTSLSHAAGLIEIAACHA